MFFPTLLLPYPAPQFGVWQVCPGLPILVITLLDPLFPANESVGLLLIILILSLHIVFRKSVAFSACLFHTLNENLLKLTQKLQWASNQTCIPIEQNNKIVFIKYQIVLIPKEHS